MILKILKLRICDICVTVNCLLLNMEVKIVQWQSVGPKSITITWQIWLFAPWNHVTIFLALCALYKLFLRPNTIISLSVVGNLRTQNSCGRFHMGNQFFRSVGSWVGEGMHHLRKFKMLILCHTEISKMKQLLFFSTCNAFSIVIIANYLFPSVIAVSGYSG